MIRVAGTFDDPAGSDEAAHMPGPSQRFVPNSQASAFGSLCEFAKLGRGALIVIEVLF